MKKQELHAVDCRFELPTTPKHTDIELCAYGQEKHELPVAVVFCELDGGEAYELGGVGGDTTSSRQVNLFEKQITRSNSHQSC